MSATKYNERSWAIDLISDINQWHYKKNLVIKRAGGERTIKTEKNLLFPDVLLFGDDKSGTILQGWELKMPDTDIDDEEFIKNASKKADILGLNSFLLWNVSYAVLYIKKNTSFEKLKTWDSLSFIKTREEVEPARDKILELMANILEELNQFLLNGTVKTSAMADTVTNSNITHMLLSNIPLYAEELKSFANKHYEFEDEVAEWWYSSKGEYSPKEDMWNVLARNNLIAVFNKFVFAHVLKKYNNDAELVETITQATSVAEGIATFEKISTLVDFWNIFSSNMGEKIIPKLAWDNFIQFNELLSTFNVNNIDAATMHELLEKLVTRSKRKVAGQFATPPALAKLFTHLVIQDVNGDAIDPCCGTGTIAKSIYQYKKARGIEEPLETTWASDKFALPIKMATLTMVEPENIGKMIKLFRHDAMKLLPGEDVVLRDPVDGSPQTQKLPSFENVLSNLPFVQQESLAALNSGASDINSFITETTNDRNLSINARSDLYVYLPFYLWKILSKNGRLGIIISNSWLSSSFGNDFFASLKRFYDIESIITSGKGRWFSNASVVTNIVILRKRESPEINTPQKIKFITINKDLSQLQEENQLTDLRSMINNDSHFDNELLTKHVYTEKYENQFNELELPLNAHFADLSWLSTLEAKTCSIKEHLDVTRGERRGWDEMFYPGNGKGIEPEYLKPVLRTPRSLKSLGATSDDLAFCCEATLDELEQQGHVNALKWIKKFENKTNLTNVPLPVALKMSGANWYTMKSSSLADYVTAINPGDRIFFGRFESPTFVNQRLLSFSLKNESKKYGNVLHALLNCTLTMFYIEALGFGRGEGVLDLNADKIKQRMKILDPRQLSANQMLRIEKAFQPLLLRDVKPLSLELESTDRAEFDKVVLEAFELSEIYPDMIKSLKSLYKIRVSVNT